MEFISLALIGYLVGVVIIAARLGWHMVFRLDRFDWQYAKIDVWFMYVMASLLWPLLLFRPSWLLHPGNLFQIDLSKAAMGREDARFWSNPPPCGKWVRYRPIKVYSSGGEGEFVFCSCDVEEAILAKLQLHPNFAKDQIGSVLKWLQQRNESIFTPTPIPSQWWNLYAIADNLVRKGLGEVRCLTCNQQVPNEVLMQNDRTGQHGWNFNQLRCPQGHTLLCVETAHIFVGARKAVGAECDPNV